MELLVLVESQANCFLWLVCIIQQKGRQIFIDVHFKSPLNYSRCTSPTHLSPAKICFCYCAQHICNASACPVGCCGCHHLNRSLVHRWVRNTSAYPSLIINLCSPRAHFCKLFKCGCGSFFSGLVVVVVLVVAVVVVSHQPITNGFVIKWWLRCVARGIWSEK